MFTQVDYQRSVTSPDNLARLLRTILTVNAIALGLVAGVQSGLDLLAYFFNFGPMAASLYQLPEALGAFEAHSLALLFAVVIFHHRAHPGVYWHLVAASIHLLLGTANLLFWPVFTSNDLVHLGILATSAHALFLVLEVSAVAIRLRHVRPADTPRAGGTERGRGLTS